MLSGSKLLKIDRKRTLMNRKTIFTVVAGVLVAGSVALVATQLRHTQSKAPATVKAPAPKLLALHFDEALAQQKALLKAAKELAPNAMLPTPVAHSAGASAVAKMEAREEAAPQAPDLADKKSIALWFSGNSIGETDPCG